MNDNSIRINNFKRGSSRIVYILNYLLHYIDKWKEIMSSSRYLFCSRYKKKLLPDYVQRMVKRYAKKIALDKDIHPHALLHSIAII